MRIWSLHPKYLDSKGLVALWRETLLAQNVLLEKTKGYKSHPQLGRFKLQPDPLAAIGNYLLGVYDEAVTRGYNFNKDKIVYQNNELKKVAVTKGQLEYELEHLKRKLKSRDPMKYQGICDIKAPEAHYLFNIIGGGIERWEK